ncbi:glycine cleavage system aminomethyltransferase GcvT [Acrocarpospora macrocephala]|uniref:Aminomethyltransferase n=1 Tax=Acrocarpospora macrocephala TaxID=150177 RepID=A0A5M3WLZ0_9ACTN|nr:glycine cleavage system aminomethyltransferase GcvT [Acrocarpospora macrocephala]GES09874.1 aminomethyltransferase [Acrocarpospora macrocephala]
MPRQTPLHEVHQSLGATLTDFAGWLMPLRYGSESAEHNTVRTDAGLFDLSHMGEIFVTGPQAGEALDYAFTGQLSTLAPGKARYTVICAPDGGVLDDVIIYRLTAEEFMVCANASNYPRVAAELADRAARFEAKVADRSEEYALIAIQGPRSQEILATLTDADLDGLKYYAGLPGVVAGAEALIARTGYTGEDGFELFIANAAAVPLWHALTAAGARPAGLSARDTLRLEAGMALYGNELTEEITPFDAGLGRVVKFDKPGDFIGRAALETKTEPRRRLVGLVARGRRVPRHGYPVVDASGAVVGEVTSGAPSQSLGKPIAMAYVQAEMPENGDLAVDIRGTREPVDVVDLPFYRRKK